LSTGVVHTFFSLGQMDAFLAPGEMARILIAVQCDEEFGAGSNWGITLANGTSSEYGEWGNDPDLIPMDNSSSSLPTLVLSNVDLLYPLNELVVRWNGYPDPEPSSFSVRVWVVYK
jgi:hypothetical protein